MNKYELPAVDDQPLWDLWLATYWQPAVVAADELGIFSFLKTTPSSPEALAEAMALNLRGTKTLLRLLASLKLLDKKGEAFHLSPYAESFLHADGQFYWGPMLRFGLNHTKVQKVLVTRLQAPENGKKKIEGMSKDFWVPIDDWSTGDIDPEKASYIAASMHSHSLVAAVKTSQSAAFAPLRTVLDVGGGSGCFSIALAQNQPQLSCTVLELPAMCEVTERYIRDAGASGRVKTLPLDMFRGSWPGHFDAHFFSNIFHDWTEETCAGLARKSFEALPPGGKIFVHEMLLDDDGCGPRTTVSFSMLMFLTTLGQQFTFAELRTILEGAGFTNVTVTATHGYYSLVSGEKARG